MKEKGIERLLLRPKEAAEQFTASLLRMPNRTASLLGAARAAVALEEMVRARETYEKLVEIWHAADRGHAGLSEARGHLTGNGD